MGVIKILGGSLGIGASFALAGITYYTFHFLDRNASAAANRAISQLLTSETYRKIDLTHAIVNAFDRIYGIPVFSIRGLFRIAIYSIILGNLVVILTNGKDTPLAFAELVHDPDARARYVYGAFCVMLSDFITLIAIRWRLQALAERLIWGFAIGFGVAISIVLGIWLVAVYVATFFFTCGASSIECANSSYIGFLADIMSGEFPIGYIIRWTIPPLFALAWMPLFIIGILIVKGLSATLKAVQWAQWFLKNGANHPLLAIGWIAAVIVFSATSVFLLF